MVTLLLPSSINEKQKDMIDCKSYSKGAFLQLLRSNDKYCYKIATAKTWEQVLKCIDRLNVSYTEEQIAYVKQKKWTDKL